LLATIVPVLMIHLIDYRRSVLAAAASLVLIGAVAGYVLYLNDAWPWLPAALPFMVWGVNGIRATQADRAMG
jgi:hypothetical protein